MVPLPDWDSIALASRTVYICFDSDVTSNQNVGLALARLKSFLVSKKAACHVIILPPLDNDKKQGLDDYFANGHTVEQLLSLVDDTRLLREEQNALIEEFNQDAAVVTLGNKVLVQIPDYKEELDRHEFAYLSFEHFCKLHSNRFVAVEDGKFAKAAPFWLNHTDRRAYKGIGFSPGKILPDDHFICTKGLP